MSESDVLSRVLQIALCNFNQTFWLWHCFDLQKLGFDSHFQSGIISLRTPPEMNVRKAAYEFHKQGIFLNSIEYPAVPINQQRFRISIMATHTKEDIDRLIECVKSVWIAATEKVKEKELLVA